MPAILYLTAAVVLVDQIAILLASVVPLSPRAVQWRYGAVGLAVGRGTPFLLADLLLLSGAFLANHRGFLRALGFLHVFVAPILLAGLALFALDAMEIRRLLPLDARRQALISAGRAALSLLAFVLFAVWVGWKILRATPARPGLRSADRLLVLDGRVEETR